METAAECIARMSARLETVSDTPRLDAELLLAHALGMSRAALLARLREPVSTDAVAPLLARRLNYEPLAYIFGEWEFFGLPFWVRPPLLTPRPETEHLVETALTFLKQPQRDRPRVIDICCGTGCVAVTLARHARNAVVYASDIRLDALCLTRENAARHHVSVHCIQADLLTALTDSKPSFDVVVANPPYVPDHEWTLLSPVITRHEAPTALLAGTDGLDVIRRLIPQARRCLRAHGLLALELGEDQYEAAAALMAADGFIEVGFAKDLAGTRRVIHGRRG